MTRTFRDKERVKRKKYWDAWLPEYSNSMRCKTSLKKLKRNNEENETRYPTPSWWTNLMMNKPRRQEIRLFEHNVLLCADLEEVDPPTNWRKPHIYYW